MSAAPAAAWERRGPKGGEVLVLLHSLALDRSVWDRLLPHLAPEWAVVRVDLPGHGRAAPVRETSVEAMADAAVAVLDAEGIGRATLVGLSMGGTVALAATIRHPDRVARLATADCTAWYGPDGPANWEARARRAEADGLASMAEFQMTRWFTPPFLDARPEVVAAAFSVFTANDIASYMAACRALGAADLREGLAGIRCPVAVAVGEHDGATPPEHARAIAAAVPGATLRIIPDCAHLSALERPEAVAEVIASLMAREATP